MIKRTNRGRRRATSQPTAASVILGTPPPLTWAVLEWDGPDQLVTLRFDRPVTLAAPASPGYGLCVTLYVDGVAWPLVAALDAALPRAVSFAFGTDWQTAALVLSSPLDWITADDGAHPQPGSAGNSL